MKPLRDCFSQKILKQAGIAVQVFCFRAGKDRWTDCHCVSMKDVNCHFPHQVLLSELSLSQSIPCTNGCKYMNEVF